MSEPIYFNPNDYACVFVGVAIQSGFAEDQRCKIERLAETYQTKVGVDGTVTRVRLHNNVVRITIYLTQKAEGNALLHAIHKLDKSSVNGGVAPTTIKDLEGSEFHFMAHSWIAKAPDAGVSKDPLVQEWVIEGVLTEEGY